VDGGATDPGEVLDQSSGVPDRGWLETLDRGASRHAFDLKTHGEGVRRRRLAQREGERSLLAQQEGDNRRLCGLLGLGDCTFRQYM